MRQAKVFVHGKEAGILTEYSLTRYTFQYHSEYQGNPVSLTMPLKEATYTFDTFPPFFEGLLPEGYNKNQLLKLRKIDSNDLFSQLVYLGDDFIGATTVLEIITNE